MNHKQYNFGVALALGAGVGVALGSALKSVAQGIAITVGLTLVFYTAFRYQSKAKDDCES